MDDYFVEAKPWISSMADAGKTPNGEFNVGTRIMVTDAAGPRLANKHGIVIGSGRYRDAVRVTLDGAKTSMTLHKKYLSYEAAS